MPKALRRHLRPRCRTLSRRKLKRERPVLVHSFREVRTKQLASLRLQKLRILRQKLKRDLKNLLSRRKKPRMSRNPTHEIRIPVMNLAPDLVVAKGIPGRDATVRKRGD